MTDNAITGLSQPGPHEPGRKQCAGCPKMAAIRRMVLGPDGLLYGSGCARKRGYTTTTGRRPGALTAPPARRPRPVETIQTSLFDQENPMPENPPAAPGALTTARRFVIARDDERLLDGVLWPDGSCSLRWRQEPRSFVSWDTFADAERMHCGGDPAVSAHVIWVDPDTAGPDLWSSLRDGGHTVTYTFNTKAMLNAGLTTQVNSIRTALHGYGLNPDKVIDNQPITFDLDKHTVTAGYLIGAVSTPGTITVPYNATRLPRTSDFWQAATPEQDRPSDPPQPVQENARCANCKMPIARKPPGSWYHLDDMTTSIDGRGPRSCANGGSVADTEESRSY